MLPVTEANVKTWSELGSRGAFGKAILDIGEKCPNVVVLTADLSDATKVTEFSRRYPGRFVQVGIAEQNLMGIAAGLAQYGKVPFATTFAAFASMRCCEQVRTDVAYMDGNVKIVGADAGVVMGTLGTTHYAIEDIAIFRAMPNMTILSPCDGAEVTKATWAAATSKGPVYLRLTGGKNAPVVHEEDFDFQIGRAVKLRDGKDVTVIATGSVVAPSVGAARQLEKEGLGVRVLDMHTIKPLDEEAVERAARDTRLIVTVEEHSRIGGLGSAVAEFLSATRNAPRIIRLGLPDQFGHIANYQTLLKRYGFTAESIADAVRKNLAQD